ncbi:ATP-binding protein [Streptomyces sp. NBC_01262]|uniref:ATP-binding protein n=1 Tax=Streptomyces sp. NBC_01262 TaxID=2903803 RepID=UPI002E35866A|nr:tetratricopeptide repeat protein [Streptomyces sp. NBC_01262]
MDGSLLAALAEGAAGDAGRRALAGLAAVLDGRTDSAALAEAAADPARRERLREWGAGLQRLLGDGERAAVAAAMDRHTAGSGAAWYRGDHVDFGGGVFLGQVNGIQVVLPPAGPAPVALDALPARATGFTGRGDELARLLEALGPAASDPEAAVLVAAVSGLGGIGKTALAVIAGHEARARGWFPGGALFVDLHGYDEVPVTADLALQSLLRAMGIPPEHIPVTGDERAAFYRAALADREPTLILVDNASSPGQIRPLLPGDSRHRVLVTSRDKLPQLGARLLPLGVLPPEDAYDLLDRALRAADPTDHRILDDPAGAKQLATLCGHLPLALQIAAALLVADLGMPVAELANELDLDDGERSVRATLDLSYRRLSEEQKRLLRLLAVAPGPDVGNDAIAPLVEDDAPPLKGLERAHLIERASGRTRWRLHDLVRAYAAGLAEASGEAEAARERLLEFYYRWTEAADDHLRWLPGLPVPPLFAGRVEALEWLDAERANLVAAAQWADDDRHAPTAVDLALCLGVYLDWRRYFDDQITVCRCAQRAAARTGDQPREARAWNGLGLALVEAGRAAEAIEAHTRARELFQATDDHNNEAVAWNGLGIALQVSDRVTEAIDAHTRARDLFQATGDRNREAQAWNNLGIALQVLDRVTEAIDAHTRDRNICQETGDRNNEAMAWSNLGVVLRVAGRATEAIDAYRSALELFAGYDNWYETGRALYNLAVAHQATGDPTAARTAWRQAADAYARANAPTEAADARRRAQEP